MLLSRGARAGDPRLQVTLYPTWPGSWLQGSLILPICQPVCMFCAVYNVSVLKFRKRSKKSDREAGSKEGGREEGRKKRGRREEGGKRDSRQGATEGKTGGSSLEHGTELWFLAGLQPPITENYFSATKSRFSKTLSPECLCIHLY